MMFAQSRKITILERVVRQEQEAFDDCLDTYGNLIWSLALRHTDSSAEAEQAVQEIFAEIWKYSARFDAVSACEKDFVVLISFHYLINKFGENKGFSSMVNSGGSQKNRKYFQ